MSNASNATIDSRLRLPFKFNDIEWKVSARTRDESRGMVAPYINARAVRARLNDVCGAFQWLTTVTPFDRGLILTLSIDLGHEQQVSRTGESGWTKEHPGDPGGVKGAASNALKRAAAQFGIGEYLYNIAGLWIALENGRMPRDSAHFVHVAANHVPVRYRTDDWPEPVISPFSQTETVQDQRRTSNADTRSDTDHQDLKSHDPMAAISGWSEQKRTLVLGETRGLEGVEKVTLIGAMKLLWWGRYYDKAVQVVTHLEIAGMLGGVPLVEYKDLDALSASLKSVVVQSNGEKDNG